jgi:putative transcriptional regulator
MTQYHPTTDMLAEYASGGLSDGLSLVVASHLTYCPVCRRRVEALERVGGAMLDAAGPVEPLAPPSLADALARIDALGADERVALHTGSVLPAPILQRLGGTESDIAWKFRLPGLSEYVIEDGEESVSLLRARPGTRMLAHTHGGDEATLVFSGAMRDGGRVYRRGDVALADHEDDHRPEIIGDEVCYCLIVMSGHMQFTGRFGKVLNIFTG